MSNGPIDLVAALRESLQAAAERRAAQSEPCPVCDHARYEHHHNDGCRAWPPCSCTHTPATLDRLKDKEQ